MSLINELTKIGLSDKEAKVYLATLELGQSSVQEIGKKAEVNRATTYVILNSLITKGLASTYSKDKKTYFMAESPDNVITVLELQKKALEEKQKHIQELLPQLKTIYNKQEDKPVVRFFEGIDGLRSMVNEQMSSSTKLLRGIFSMDDLADVYSNDEINKAYGDRLQKKQIVKAIYTYKNKVLGPDEPGDERIKIPEDKFPIKCDIAIFDNKIRIASLRKKNGVIIEDEDIIKTFASIFELAFEAAKARAEKNK